jgi:hypothetical protein
LNFKSNFELRIIDSYFGEISLVPIAIILTDRTNKKSDEIRVNKMDRVYENETNFHILNKELKTLFDCKIRNNDIFEDCNSFYYSNLMIFKRKYRSEDNFDFNQFLKMKYYLINGSFIDNFIKNQNIVILLKYLELNSKNRNFKEFSLNRKRIIDKSYWKQKPFIQISTNSTKFSEYLLAFDLNKNVGYETDFQLFSFNQNKEYSLGKKSLKFLEFPYESKCSYYESSETIFNSLSHEHCIRQCIRYNCEVKLNCSCFVINFKDEILDQLDFGFQNLEFCQNDDQLLETFTQNYTKICKSLCPIDCINDEYIIINKYKNDKKYSDSKFWNLRFHWDESKPIIINEETPVMTFSHFFCYIGGLFGMWFGISADQLFIKFIEKHNICYIKLLYLLSALSNKTIESIKSIKSKITRLYQYFKSFFIS